ncbi:6-phospho-beta-glucosidase [Limosilactobacillus reuteri]|nr:6-phospho-beta-glucosidase [Limosilactobacillus reuteri]PWT49212.1 6-phospho-beta-glucosidase [Limosilactobacillus reuteri]PWT56459.1 6-phospho-beta-glucosidase [Limosilactobacillus reuteri]
MSSENITIERWKTQFKETAQQLANELIAEAKTKNTYGEATAYIRKISQQAYGDITDPEDRAGMAVNDAICSLAVRRLHEEERSLPINKED